eukprot:4407984-Alexandrium_andersonii.AAC.1
MLLPCPLTSEGARCALTLTAFCVLVGWQSWGNTSEHGAIRPGQTELSPGTWATTPNSGGP